MASGRGFAAHLNLPSIGSPDVRPSRSFGTGERRVLELSSYFFSTVSRQRVRRDCRWQLVLRFLWYPLSSKASPMTKRKDQQYEAKLAALRAAIHEGMASGIAKGDVLRRVRRRLKLLRTPR
jgi:hypothetical protein